MRYARKPVPLALRDIHVEIMTKARPLRMIFQSFVALIALARLLREMRGVRVVGAQDPLGVGQGLLVQRMA